MTEPNTQSSLTHFDDSGATRMIDVSHKAVTTRTATAQAQVVMSPDTLQKIQNKAFAKGNVLEVARLAGIMGAKQTALLIPLCHHIPLEGVEIAFDVVSETSIRISSSVHVTAKTGVEMEALTAVTIAALTIYDMCKAIDRDMQISNVQLQSKSGGRSGTYTRSEAGIESGGAQLHASTG